MFQESIIPVSVGIIVLLLLVAIVAGAIQMIRKKEAHLDLNMRSFLRVYLYFIALVSLMIAISGGARAIKAGLSYSFGYEFSYQKVEYFSSPDVKIEGEASESIRYDQSQENQRRDLINGLSLSITLLLIFAIHRGFAWYMDRKVSKESVLLRSYIFGNLILYSILGIISIPASIYQIINYNLLDLKAIDAYSRPIPGDPLGAAIIILPVWILFLIQALILQRKEQSK